MLIRGIGAAFLALAAATEPVESSTDTAAELAYVRAIGEKVRNVFAPAPQPESQSAEDQAALLAEETWSPESLLLMDILTSHGRLDPATVSPTVRKYSLYVEEPTSHIGLMPRLNSSCVAEMAPSLGELIAPSVKIDWPGLGGIAQAETYSYAIRQQIRLPEDGSDLPVTITVSSPQKQQQAEYKVLIKQKYPPPAQLVTLDGADDSGMGFITSPSLTESESVYNLYVSPAARKLQLQLRCSKGARLYVNGKETKNDEARAVTLKRELFHHTQVVDVKCLGRGAAAHYRLNVISDHPEEEIAPPENVRVFTTGQPCVFEKGAYYCPNPHTSGRIQLLAENDPTVKYVVENKAKSIQVRLLNGIETIPFTYTRGGLHVYAEAGRYHQVWPIYFNGNTFKTIMTLLGWILAILLAVLLFAMLAVIGAASTMSMGVPLGAIEVAATMTFIIQYLCFAQFIRGSSKLTEFVAPIRWVTIFWPVPWQQDRQNPGAGGEHQRRLLGVNQSRSSYGGSPWGNSIMGDVSDWRNACGAVFWVAAIFALFLLIHGCILLKFYVLESRFTIPHRVKLGNWESRCLHWLAFPASTGAAFVLSSSSVATGWKVAASLLYAFYVGWLVFVLVEVHTAVQTGRVAWMWNSSVREDGTLEDESGLWVDAVSDQLLTQPVNRSLCRGFFPFKWISTVADIMPVALNPAVVGDQRPIYPPQKYHRSFKEPNYVMGKTPQIVEVVKARVPKGLCSGQRLIAGLLRTQWLDILFTYQALTIFHNQGRMDNGDYFSAPLVAKSSQLSGPITSGRQAFFFDGARIPFIRIGDSLYRILVGVFIGVTLSSPNNQRDAILFAMIGILSAVWVAYVALTQPYTRSNENWLSAFMYSTVAASAFSFVLLYALRFKEAPLIADLFLWLIIVCCFVLAGYACIVIFSISSAIFCPPLEESRFLEKLSNSSLVISNEAPRWSVEVPSYSKYPAKDLQMHATQTGSKRCHVAVHATHAVPSFEYKATQVAQACRTGSLPIPVATVFIADKSTSLGYRHLILDGRSENIPGRVSSFLGTDSLSPFSSYAQQEIGRYIENEIATRGRGGKILLCITLTAP